jgi:putative glutamine amidotransferase
MRLSTGRSAATIYRMRPRIAIPVPNSDAGYSTRALPEYVNSILGAGGEPVVLDLTLTSGEAAQLAKSCDGILLPGSPADVDPQKYGQAPHPRTAAPDAPRDNLDELLLQDAHNMRKPILAICYGTQTLNVWRNGTLVQHIESPVQHARPDGAPRTVVIEHTARVEPGSCLSELTGAGEITVNSSHHQAVATPGDSLRVVARSPQDSIIEAVEGNTPGHWVLGVQWHPERTFQKNEASRRIFEKLISEARAFHQRLARTSPDFENVRPE